MIERGNPVETQANKIPKPNKKETTIERCNLCDDPEIPEWLQEFRENLGGWWNSITGRLSRQFFSWSLFRADYKETRILVSIMFITHFFKDRNCEICKRTKITRVPCRRRKGEAVPRADNFGDLITNSRPQGPKRQLRVSKQSSIRSRGTGSSYSMDPGVSVQKQNFTRNPEKLAKSSWNPRGNQKSFTLTIPWNSAKLVKIFPGIIARLHHIDRRPTVLPKEQCAE